MSSSNVSSNFFQRSSLMRDVTLSLAGLLTTILLGIGLAGYFIFANQVETQLSQQAGDLADKLKDVMAVPLWNVDSASIEQIADAYRESGNVVALRVVDSAGSLLYENVTPGETDLITESRKVFYGSNEVGRVEISLSRASLASLRRSILGALLIAGLLLIAGMMIATRLLLNRFLQRPIQQLVGGINTIAGGNYQYRFSPFRQAELNRIVEQINLMAAQVQERDRLLDQRVSARTRELALAAEVGRRISQVRDLEVLLPQAVDLIRQRFDLYYVQVYLADAAGRSLALRAGSGDVGAELLRRGHRLEIGLGSLNGRAAAERRAVIVADTTKNASFRANPLLPDTRAEMAVPLLVGEQVVGVLDLQSAQAGSLGEENLAVFDALAGQLAIAVNNATLFAQDEQQRAAVEAQVRRQTLAGWQEYLDAIERGERLGYVYDQGQIAAASQALSPFPGENALSIPLQVSGAAIGIVRLERSPDDPWTSVDMELAVAAAAQAARRLEALRMLEQAEGYRAAAEEAARRLTREGWDEYAQARRAQLAYAYDQLQVRPLAEAPSAPGAQSQSLPLRVGVETVGELAFDGLERLDPEASELVNDVVEFLSNHIENLRLNVRTQDALVETEKLYTASARVVRSATISDVLLAVIEMTSLQQFDSGSILLFNRPWENTAPEEAALFGAWDRRGETPTELGGVISLKDIPFMGLLRRDVPTFIADAETDPRLDEMARFALLAVGKSVALFPLVAGDQWIGWLSASSDKEMALSANEARQIQTLVGQAATVVQSIRLYAQTQATLAQTETLYQIGRQLNNANNVDEILEALSLPGQKQGCNETTMMYFDLDAGGKPEWMTIVANWRQSGQPALAVGARVYVPEFPSAALLLSSPNAPLLFPDALADGRIDVRLKAVLTQAQNRAFVVVPIVQAGRWLGLLTFGWLEPHSFSQADQDTYAALTGLAAPSVQSRRLLIQAQARAQREQSLRQITSAVRGSTDPTIIMRTAVREIGTVLGRKALIHLERSTIGMAPGAETLVEKTDQPTDTVEN